MDDQLRVIQNCDVSYLNNIATQINEEHANILGLIGNAMERAKIIGAYCLQAKNNLPHGEWETWAKANLNVSVRQTRRYMDVALGKSKPIREISNRTPMSDLDELSHIQNRQNLDWIPQDSALARVAFANGSILYVQEAPGLVAHNGDTGFYFVAFVQGDTIDFTAKPIHASFVEYQIKNWLPGAATRNCEVYDLPWEYSTQSDPNFVCKIINSLMKDCDQLKDKELTAT